jgi:hypothetical protein
MFSVDHVIRNADKKVYLSLPTLNPFQVCTNDPLVAFYDSPKIGAAGDIIIVLSSNMANTCCIDLLG